MPKFSETSLARLSTCDVALRILFVDVVRDFDCTIIQGHRSDEEQAEALAAGTSQLGPGESLHNRAPSFAVDAGPWYVGEGIPWEDRERFLYFGGFVLGRAAALGIPIRWGGDWDGDRLLRDQSFHDLPHFELVPR